MSSIGSSLVLRSANDPVVYEDLGVESKNPRRATSYCPCFTPGTLIKTDQGEMAVEDVRVGTRVLTRDNGYQPVIWTGQRRLDQSVLNEIPALQPIKMCKGALGPNLPERDTIVSPQHRMLLSNAQIRAWFDADEVLVAAHLLTCFEGISRQNVDEITYIHFMFEQHEIVLSDGAWSESYQPNDMRAGAMDERHRQELLTIFPELAETDTPVFPAARPTVDAKALNAAVISKL